MASHCGFDLHFHSNWVSPVAQLVKNPPTMWETWVWSLGWEDSLEKGKVTHSSILAWRIPWSTVHRVTKSWTRLSDFHFTYFIVANDVEFFFMLFVVAVQLLSCIQPVTPWTARLPCPLLSPRVCSNSYPLSKWCHPTISSSVVPFSSYLQSFPGSESFSNESVLHNRWPKYWSFSFNTSPSND